MIFLDVARIGYESAAIIDSAAQYKLDIVKEMYTLERKKRFEDRKPMDDWKRLAFGLSWESRFYRQGIREGYGIRDLFHNMFTIMGESPGPHTWDEIIGWRVLRTVSFSSAPQRADYRALDYDFTEPDFYPPQNPTQEYLLLNNLTQYLHEEVHRGVALAYWCDGAITDTTGVPQAALDIWAQIIQQAKDFYAYSVECHWRQQYPLNEVDLLFNCVEGVFAVTEPQIRGTDKQLFETTDPDDITENTVPSGPNRNRGQGKGRRS